MYNFVKNKIRYFQTPEGKRLLKISAVTVAVAVGIGAGVYFFITNARTAAEQKFVRAQNLYLEAQNVEEEQQSRQKLEQAKQLFRDLIHQRFWQKDKQEAFLYLADCYYRLGEIEKSIQTLEEFEEKYPHSYFAPWAILKHALLYERIDKYEEAIQVYNRIEEEYPQSPVAPEALLGEARCQEELNNTEKAIEVYRTLISRYPLSNESAIGEAKLQQYGLEVTREEG